MTTFDVVLRSMAAMQLVFLACLLLRKGRMDPAFRYASLLPAGLAASCSHPPRCRAGRLAPSRFR